MTKSIDHLLLAETDAESFRIFFHLHDQYCRESKAHTEQLDISGAVTTETACLVRLKLCMDVEYIATAFILDLNPGAPDYE